MKVIVIGTRGIPNILGGVETHCEELYPYLAHDSNHEITVIGRSCYVKNGKLQNFKGVKLKTVYAPKIKAFEAIVHSLLSVFYAAIKRPDVVHIHAVGPNLVTPIGRLLGLNVVMTHHGPDYERIKWGKMAKLFLKTGEWAGVKFANKVIVISEEIKKSIVEKYGRDDAVVIPNGVSIAEKPAYKKEVLERYGIYQYKYIFTLGRFVPEKGFDYLIRAFQKSEVNGAYKLVIAGDADHESEYSKSLKSQARDAGVVLTGFIKGEELSQLFAHCGLFVLPSFYEGLPISLLEAMSYNLPILASDIPANTQVPIPEHSFFPVGNEEALAQKLNKYFANKVPNNTIYYNLDNYDWKNIAANTNDVYKSIV